jgi:hypothetical protein
VQVAYEVSVVFPSDHSLNPVYTVSLSAVAKYVAWFIGTPPGCARLTTTHSSRSKLLRLRETVCVLRNCRIGAYHRLVCSANSLASVLNRGSKQFESFLIQHAS